MNVLCYLEWEADFAQFHRKYEWKFIIIKLLCLWIWYSNFNNCGISRSSILKEGISKDDADGLVSDEWDGVSDMSDELYDESDVESFDSRLLNLMSGIFNWGKFTTGAT